MSIAPVPGGVPGATPNGYRPTAKAAPVGGDGAKDWWAKVQAGQIQAADVQTDGPIAPALPQNLLGQSVLPQDVLPEYLLPKFESAAYLNQVNMLGAFAEGDSGADADGPESLYEGLAQKYSGLLGGAADSSAGPSGVDFTA